ncbi:DedA family protein [Deinococcus sp. KNUC1210]|uniref:DedA family protein n=1 Tax=Deinococcus sp. KNUC1210 TaxID=2917691 RepID=UPI001EF1318B|nr:DedA family protein [Deinococcus sp. KNUC1210]ULH15360.1 DedA family protein [Deinococcus sp. KNUC1210]
MTVWLDSLSPVWLHLTTFVMMFLEGMGIPGIPGVLPMLALAESIHAGQTTLLEAIFWGVAGNWTGSLIGYRLAASALKRLPSSWQRVARSPHTARLMTRWGGLLVIISRTFGSLRTPVTLYAGASGYPWRRYLIFSLLGALLHVGVWQTLLWRFGPGILKRFEQAQGQVLPYVALLLGGVVLWWVWRWQRGRNQEKLERG